MAVLRPNKITVLSVLIQTYIEHGRTKRTKVLIPKKYLYIIVLTY